MRKFLCLLTLVLGVHFLNAQNILTGKIRDSKTNQPLPGVSIKIQGGSTGTITSNDGNFRINVSPGASLEISMVGYKTEVIKVSSETELNINLEPAGSELTEITFIGTRS